MEIFLLLVVILLLIIFNSSKNSKLKKTEERLSNIENYLKKVSFSQTQKTSPTTTPLTEAVKDVHEKVVPPIPPVIVPPVVSEEPVIIKETITAPIKEVEKTEKVEAPIAQPVKANKKED